MIAGRPHRMLVIHNDSGSGHRMGVIEPKPLRRFAWGSLLTYADEVFRRLSREQMFECSCLALPGGVPSYGREQLVGISSAQKFDSVMCHLVLDHGGVLTDEFFTAVREEFLAPGGRLLNPVKSIAKDEVARVSPFELETTVAPCVVKKNDNYNLPETVLEMSTQAELDAWRAGTPAEEQARYVVHKRLESFNRKQSGMYQLERWIVVFDDLTVNHRASNEFYIKSATSLSYYARDERRMTGDLRRLASAGYDWKGRSIDCAYDSDAEAWDARYRALEQCRSAFHFDYAELDVIQPSKNEFVVIDVNQTPGPSYRNVYFRELAVRLLAERLEIKPLLTAPLSSEGGPDLPEEEEPAGDPKALEEELARDPNDAHAQFRLARAYAAAGQLEQAHDAYTKRAAMEHGSAEERFVARLEAGRLSIRLDAPEPVVVGELLGAYILRPARAEPLYELAHYHRERKNYATATLFAKAGVQIARPADRLHLAPSVYSWQLLDELASAAYFVGDHACARRAWETVLARVQDGLSVPSGDLERMRQSLEKVVKGTVAAAGIQRLS